MVAEVEAAVAVRRQVTVSPWKRFSPSSKKILPPVPVGGDVIQFPRTGGKIRDTEVEEAGKRGLM